MTARELQREQFFAKLEQRGSGVLALDYDGTLAPFKKDRHTAVPYAGVRELIGDIMATGDTRVVLISGRPAEEVRSLLGLTPAPEIWGVHGLQRLRQDGSCESVAIKDLERKTLQEAAAWLEENDLGHLAEQKPGSVAVHWRGLPLDESDRINGKVRSAWVPLAARGQMSLLEFDGGIELRVGGWDKGKAVLTVLGELDPGTPLAFLGDDTTDEDAFVALQGSGALTVLVRTEWRETNAEVWIRPPDELLQFFREWLERIGGGR
ncbi:MAG TPA: trehalose-phosphatase [Terriglobales bacterium]|jgi:trehalose-phosphatase